MVVARSAGSHPTRAEVIAELRRLTAKGRKGTILAQDVAAHSRSLYFALLKFWGTIARARRAAGITDPERKRKWSREKILREIRRLHEAGQHMAHDSLIEAGHRGLVLAARGYLGSWTRARDLAGVPPPTRTVSARTYWTQEALRREIRSRWRSGLPLASSKVPRALRDAARNHGHGWREAIEAAGVPYDQVRLGGRYDDDELFAWLRRMAKQSPQMTVSTVYQMRRGYACRYRWGSIEAAARLAGLDGWPLRHAQRTLTKHEVIDTLKTMSRQGIPLSFGNVNKSLKHSSPLTRGALIHFSSWDAAIEAAGLPSQRAQRTWSREAVIAALQARHRAGLSLRSGPVTQDDSALPQVARRLFGSYSAAVVAAGIRLEPQQQWSAARVLAELRSVAGDRTVLRQRDAPSALVGATKMYFGTWTAACAAAGLSAAHRPITSAEIAR